MTRWSLLLVGLAACSRSSPNATQDEVTYVKSGDRTMAAAVAKAQASLETFRTVLAAPPANTKSFSVKVGVPWGIKDDREHLWLTEPKLAATSVTGTINNEPVDATSLKLGEVVTAPLADISDWMYVENGILRGGYTLRVLLDKMSPEARTKMLNEMGFRLE